MRVHDIIPRADGAKKGCRVIRARWVLSIRGSDDQPQLRARWVAQECRGRGGDRYAYFSETLDLALVKAVIALVVQRADQRDKVGAVSMSAERTLTLRRRGTLPLSFQTTCPQTCALRTWESCANHCMVLGQRLRLGAMS